ncbi:helix-turn-helix domain-containing protein [Methylobacterium sp. Gmos1]
MNTFFSWQHAVRDSKLEPTTKLVCYTIGLRMAADGTGCFPSYSLIAEESGLSRSTVIDHIGRAERAGYLVKESRDRPNGSATSNIYRPCMPGGGPGNGPGVVRQLDQGSPGAGLGVVRELDPHNKPSEQTKEQNTPQPPVGEPWVFDEKFQTFMAEFQKVAPSHRVDPDDAFRIWGRKGGCHSYADQIIQAVRAFAGSQGWKKDGGQYIPTMSKFLSSGIWRNPPTSIDYKNHDFFAHRRNKQ